MTGLNCRVHVAGCVITLYCILFNALLDKPFAFLGHPPELLSIRGADVLPYFMERFGETSNDLTTVAAGRTPSQLISPRLRRHPFLSRPTQVRLTGR